jgi:hypothetical protein
MSVAQNSHDDKVKDLPLGDDGAHARHVLEHDKVSFVSDDQDEGVTRIEALCALSRKPSTGLADEYRPSLRSRMEACLALGQYRSHCLHLRAQSEHDICL